MVLIFVTAKEGKKEAKVVIIIEKIEINKIDFKLVSQ